MRILILEDEDTSRELLTRIIAPYADLDYALDGEEAVAAFKAAHAAGRPYAAVFLDIEVPKLSGRKALEQMRAHERELNISDLCRTKALMVTAHTEDDNIWGALFVEGCDVFIGKPFGSEVVLEQMHKLKLISLG